MAKNRKNQSAAIRFGPVIKVFLLCGMLCGAGVGFVWQKGKIDELGRQRVKQENRLAELERQNDKLKRQLAWMRSFEYLEQHVKDMNLAIPSTSQIWRLPEPAPEPTSAHSERQYAQKNGAEP